MFLAKAQRRECFFVSRKDVKAQRREGFFCFSPRRKGFVLLPDCFIVIYFDTMPDTIRVNAVAFIQNEIYNNRA